MITAVACLDADAFYGTVSMAVLGAVAGSGIAVVSVSLSLVESLFRRLDSLCLDFRCRTALLWN